MGTWELAVTGGIIVSGKGLKRGDILVRDGLVDRVGLSGEELDASRVIDVSGKFILPGLIDAHVHPVYADGIDTLSKAAACAGITTIVSYIGAVKAWGLTGGLVETIDRFREEGHRTSVVDFGVHCSLMKDDVGKAAKLIPEMVRTGVISFKCFMAYAKRGMMVGDDEMLRLMEIIAESGALLSVHAENGAVIDFLEDRFTAQGNQSPPFYTLSHPNLAEAEAVFRALTLGRTTGCPVYFPHLSAWQSLEVVRMFKAWGEAVFFTETCPQYLTLTSEEMQRRGALAKVAPPLRERHDVERMWEAVAQGLIDVVGSDTAGRRIEDNEPLWEEIFKAPYGMPGVDMTLPILYHEGVNAGRITLPRLVELTSERPAKIFGLYPTKGVLEEGSDADMVVLDPAASQVVQAQNPHLKVDYNLYEGRAFLGGPALVIQRGKVLSEGGELKAQPGQGRFVPGKPPGHKPAQR